MDRETVPRRVRTAFWFETVAGMTERARAILKKCVYSQGHARPACPLPNNGSSSHTREGCVVLGLPCERLNELPEENKCVTRSTDGASRQLI